MRIAAAVRRLLSGPAAVASSFILRWLSAYGTLAGAFFRKILRQLPALGSLLRRLWVGGVVAALAGFSLNLFDVQDEICSIPAGHAISDACGALGLGGRPERKERERFERLAPGDCSALAKERPTFASESIQVEIGRRLATRRLIRSDEFVPLSRKWDSYVRKAETAALSEAEAHADVRRRVEQDAIAGCAPRSEHERFVRAEITSVQLAGCKLNRCAADYTAICRMEHRPLRERCY